MNVLITGANRGIGLGFVRHYLENGDTVWAAYRKDRGGLADINNPKLHCLRWDVSQTAPTEGDMPDSIDILINNAGIYGPGKSAGQDLHNVTADTMHEVFDIDCLGALRVVQHCLPALKAGGATIANISSKMGSSADNSSGGCYAYRAAKAALVIVSRSMSIDLAPSGIRVITLHPGWVRTDMTDHSGLIDVEQSVAGLTGVIANVDQYEPGAFVAFDGKVIPY